MKIRDHYKGFVRGAKRITEAIEEGAIVDAAERACEEEEDLADLKLEHAPSATAAKCADRVYTNLVKVAAAFTSAAKAVKHGA